MRDRRPVSPPEETFVSTVFTCKSELSLFVLPCLTSSNSKGSVGPALKIGIFAIWAHNVDFDVDWRLWKSDSSHASEFVWQDDVQRWFADRIHAVIPAATREAPALQPSPPRQPSPPSLPDSALDQIFAPLQPDKSSINLSDSADDLIHDGTHISSPLPLARPDNEWKTIQEKAKADARRQQIPSLLEHGHFLAARNLDAQHIRKIRSCLHRPELPRRVMGTSYRRISGEDHDGVLECEVGVEGKCLGWLFSGKYCGECDAYMCRPCYDSINTKHARWQTDERREAKDRKFRANSVSSCFIASAARSMLSLL